MEKGMNLWTLILGLQDPFLGEFRLIIEFHGHSCSEIAGRSQIGNSYVPNCAMRGNIYLTFLLKSRQPGTCIKYV
jgi:hypothetical protein